MPINSIHEIENLGEAHLLCLDIFSPLIMFNDFTDIYRGQKTLYRFQLRCKLNLLPFMASFIKEKHAFRNLGYVMAYQFESEFISYYLIIIFMLQRQRYWKFVKNPCGFASIEFDGVFWWHIFAQNLTQNASWKDSWNVVVTPTNYYVYSRKIY